MVVGIRPLMRYADREIDNRNNRELDIVKLSVKN